MIRNPDVLDRLAPLFEPPRRGFEELLRRQEKKERDRRIAAIALVTAIAVTFVAVGLGTVGGRKDQTADRGALFERIHGWIVYFSSGDLVAVDPADPTERISLGYADGVQPIGWSRDGSRLLGREVIAGFAERHATLYVLGPAGPKVRLVPPGDASWGSISPDGTRVVYANPDDRGLFTVDALGGEPTLILRFNREPFIESPAWSPDGSRIAFLDFLEGSIQAYGLIVVNADGSERVVKIDDLGVGDRADPGVAQGLVWSPDGSQLAFFGYSGAGDLGRIFVVDTQTWTVQQLTNTGDSRWPAWSPDSSRIAFVRDEQLFTMRSDGGDVRKVDGVAPGPKTSIAWNPG